MAEIEAVITTPERIMKRESANSLIPPMSHPISNWARRLQLIFKIKKIELESEDELMVYLPTIISRLPTFLATILPQDNLENVLDFLMEYDAPERNISKAFEKGRMQESKPSMGHKILLDEMRLAMPMANDDTMHLLAWEALVDNLPLSSKIMQQC